MMKKFFYFLILFLIIVGFSDSVFLTYEHYALTSIGCPVSPWINCLAVTTSKYSEIFGIPLSLLGSLYYSMLLFFHLRNEKMYKHFFLVTSSFGVLFSFYLIYIQAFAIGLFCLYCLLSAAVSFLVFGLSFIFYGKYWETLVIDLFGYGYTLVLKPILFLLNAEFVHENMVKFGQNLPKPILNIFKFIFARKYPSLIQNILGIDFKTPLGLAAGFDYEARLTGTLPYIGFGFGTVGTITNSAYQGNPSPRLGRLPKSRSLLVNKGYKNLGVLETLSKFKGKRFVYPVGISIGRTNSKDLDTVEKSIEDIVAAFKTVNKLNISNSYFELNISCPNLINTVKVDFYNTNNLQKLLDKVDRLRLKKPLFVKMPIDQTDVKTLKMLKVIEKHKISGVIFGNLQTNKDHASLVKSEVKKFKMGKYSGKPTFDDSNRLIKLTYKNFKNRFVIIGCGGVFNTEDAYTKLTLGANLIQLITGMIYEGPQLIAQINRDLDRMIKDKGYRKIGEIVGSAI